MLSTKQATSDKALLFGLALLAVGIAGCVQPSYTEDLMSPENITLPKGFNQSQHAGFDLHSLNTTMYNYTVQKPTPCHALRVYETYDKEQDRVEIHNYVGKNADDQRLCAQVITPETITGNLPQGSTDVAILINDEVVHQI